jgi:hypothetical protein
MKCSRCGNIMSYEKFYGDSESFFGWRCIACGEIVDEVILEKRSLKKRLMEKKEIGQVGEF